MRTVRVQKDFAAPPERVFAHLSDHQNLRALFAPARVERIEYEITKGTPMRDHHGTMRFTPTGSGGTHLDYEIKFDAAVPGLAPAVAMQLSRSIAKGLSRVDEALRA